MPKLTISIPSEVNDKIDILKEYFATTSNSAVFSLGIEILHWIKQQSENDSAIISIKSVGDNIIVKEIPIINAQGKSENYEKLLQNDYAIKDESIENLF
jgi:hypothetical protein